MFVKSLSVIVNVYTIVEAEADGKADVDNNNNYNNTNSVCYDWREGITTMYIRVNRWQ